MTSEKLAELKRTGKTAEIVEWAESQNVDLVENEETLYFIADAYNKEGYIDEAISVYEQLLYKKEDELAAESLFIILRELEDVGRIDKLISYLDDTGLADAVLMRARYELSKLKNEELDSQLDYLKEYVDEYNDEKYYILLLENLTENGNFREAGKYLRKFDRLFLSSSFTEYVNAIRKMVESENSRPIQNSIKKLIYARTIEKKIVKAVKKDEESEEISPKEGINEKRIKTRSLTEALQFIIPKNTVNTLKNPISIEERFEDVVGMTSIRNELGNVYRTFKLKQNKEDSEFNESIKASTHFAILGNSGMGKTMLAEIIGQLLADFGIRGSEEAVSIEARDIDSQDVEVGGKLVSLSDLTLIIENIDRRRDASGKFGDFSWDIRKLLLNKKDDLSIILTGTKDAYNALCAEENEIKGLIYSELVIEKYTEEELLQMFHILAKKQKWIIDETANALIKRQLRKEQYMSTFNGGKYMLTKIEEAAKKAADRYEEMEDPTDEEMVTLIAEDFEKSGISMDVDSIIRTLDNMVGLQSVKEEVRKLTDTLMVGQKAEELGTSSKNNVSSFHMIFTGNPGTGKTTVARILSDIYVSTGMLPGNKEGLVEVSAADLIAEHVGGTKIKTRAVIDRAMGGVLFIDEAYTLAPSAGNANPFGKEAIDELLKTLEDSRDSIMVILAGYTKEMNDFMNVNPGLRSRIQRNVHFEDYSQEEMVQIFKSMIASNGKILDKDTNRLVEELIKQESQGKDFGNARGVRNLIERIIEAQNQRLADQMVLGIEPGKNDFAIVRKKDIEAVLEHSTDGSKTVEELMQELDEMEGLSELKAVVHDNYNKVLAAKKRKAAGGNYNPQLDNLHMVFQGNPGTGKTTVARKVGYIYKALGILPKGDTVIECSRGNMVASVVGGTAPMVNDLIDQARGGVLFIDEAYTLNQGSNDQFGKEAIDALVAPMENNAGQFMVIMAGYTKQMKEFIDTNIGLKSRISHFVNFGDFSPDEMVKIFKNMARNAGYKVNEDALSDLRQIFVKRSRDKAFGNARGVRNTLKEVLGALDGRIASSNVAIDEYYTITKEDVYRISDANNKDSVSAEELLSQLNNMIGLRSVKNKVNEIVNREKYKELMRSMNREVSGQGISLHLLFKGNPGTGKTTVAKLLGEIYKSLGVLRIGHVVQVSPTELIAGYVGQTRTRTQEYCDDAMGGILFVDEAYGLDDKGGNGFGHEALECILVNMENHRDDLMVIFAGYNSDIDSLLRTNPGFKSRFPEQNTIIFENYSIDELVQIFESVVRQNGLHIESDALTVVREILVKQMHEEDFGNARNVRNLFEKVEAKHIDRIINLKATGVVLDEARINTILKEDVS